jgi:hypothetical protein
MDDAIHVVLSEAQDRAGVCGISVKCVRGTGVDLDRDVLACPTEVISEVLAWFDAGVVILLTERDEHRTGRFRYARASVAPRVEGNCHGEAIHFFGEKIAISSIERDRSALGESHDCHSIRREASFEQEAACRERVARHLARRRSGLDLQLSGLSLEVRMRQSQAQRIRQHSMLPHSVLHENRSIHRSHARGPRPPSREPAEPKAVRPMQGCCPKHLES